MKRVLTIAGSDSGGGAGIQADLKTFAAHGVFGMSAITALTAQNTLGVQGVFEVPASFVAKQIDSVASDLGADAVKIGMLSSAAIIEAVAARLEVHSLGPIVLDPVMVAKGGDSLLREDAKAALVRLLLPLASLVTPNLPEAEVLCGFAIRDTEDMRRAARAILALGPGAVVVKGGHLEDAGQSVDILFDGQDFTEFPAPRVASKNTHGTGCTFSSAIAAGLALGLPLGEAVGSAKAYVSRIIAASADLGLGHGHGPMNHMAGLDYHPRHIKENQMNKTEKPYRHVVLFKFRPEAAEGKIRAAEAAFRDFAASLPFVSGYEWGRNSSPEKLDHGYSHCFIVTFRSEADRDAYLPHPAHQAFIRDHLDPILEEACVVDFRAQD